MIIILIRKNIISNCIILFIMPSRTIDFDSYLYIGVIFSDNEIDSI